MIVRAVHSGIGKTLGTAKERVIVGLGRRERETGGSQVLQWRVYVITHLLKSMECTPPKVNPRVNYGL